MTIHDELVLELIKPGKDGKPAGYIVSIVGTSRIRCEVEQLVRISTGITLEEMDPDIIVDLMGHDEATTERRTAVEVESDIQWDFMRSLRQVKRYRDSRLFQDVVVVIPEEYERFAVLYGNEGFKVHLWKATRIWECMQCGNIVFEQRPLINPRCLRKSCAKGEQRFKGLKDVSFRAWESR